MQLTDVPVHVPEVVGRVMDGEAVLVHAGQGMVRVLNPVAARIWELMDGQRSLAAIVAASWPNTRWMRRAHRPMCWRFARTWRGGG